MLIGGWRGVRRVAVVAGRSRRGEDRSAEGLALQEPDDPLDVFRIAVADVQQAAAGSRDDDIGGVTRPFESGSNELVIEVQGATDRGEPVIRHDEHVGVGGAGVRDGGQDLSHGLIGGRPGTHGTRCSESERVVGMVGLRDPEQQDIGLEVRQDVVTDDLRRIGDRRSEVGRWVLRRRWTEPALQLPVDHLGDRDRDAVRCPVDVDHDAVALSGLTGEQERTPR